MRFDKYFKNLSEDEQAKYAVNCGTTAKYIYTHLACSPPRKIPRKPLFDNLHLQSGGMVSKKEILDHFFGDDEKAA